MTRARRLLGSWIVVVLLPATAVGAADVQTITHGREVDLADHLVPGKFVLFDFYADWCGPCRALEPRLLELAGRHSDRLALRKVDIINWESAVARQYSVGSIPYLVLYSPDGTRIAAGDAMTVVNRLGSELGGEVGLPGVGGGRGSLVPLLAVVAIFAAAAALVVRRRRSTDPTKSPAATPFRATPVDTTVAPGDPAIWFALLQGSFEGPFTRGQLAELVRLGTLETSARVRRRGDAEWSTVVDVID
jgi:thiol-disulfide isomerase/thioredoxin